MFKKYDKVKCINVGSIRQQGGPSSLTESKVYEVACDQDADTNLYVINDEGASQGYFPDRFEAYAEPKPTLDLTKPLETQTGAMVTLITTEARGDYPVKGYINDCESLEGWTLEGEFFGNGSKSEYDLRNVAPKPMEREVYVNVYKDVDGSLDLGVTWASRSAADKGEAIQRVACIKVKLVEGQYDE